MKAELRLVKASPIAGDAEDAAALSRVATGDVGSLGEIYDRYASALLSFIHHMAPNDDAEDLVQNVFIRVVSIAHSYQPGGPSAKRWLFGIAVRIVQERRRTLRRFARLAAELASWPQRWTSPTSIERHDLFQALERLSEPKRLVLLLTEVEGFSAEETASMLGIPVGTVWTRLHHARRELRSHLEKTR